MFGTAVCICFAELSHALGPLCWVGHLGPGVGIPGPCTGSGCMDIMLPAWCVGQQIKTSPSGFGSKKRKIIILKKSNQANQYRQNPI